MRKLSSDWPRWIGSIASDDENDQRPFLVPGVRVQCIKITRSMKRRAQREAAGVLGTIEEGEERDLLDMADAGDAYSELLIRQGVIAWEGIGDFDGVPLDVSPKNIDLFLADEILFEAIDREYVTPTVLEDIEKNALSASLNGTGAAAMQVNGTATSPVVSAKAKSAANRTRKPARKAAPTSSTRPKRAKAKTSGT
jgi:hypothetical protein